MRDVGEDRGTPVSGAERSGAERSGVERSRTRLPIADQFEENLSEVSFVLRHFEQGEGLN